MRYNEIKTTELNEKKLTITKDNGKKVTFDLNDIAESDTQKLNEIMMKNTIANTVYKKLLVLAKPKLVARLLASDFPSENPRTQTRN